MLSSKKKTVSLTPNKHQLEYIKTVKNIINSGNGGNKLFYDPFEKPLLGNSLKSFYFKGVYVVDFDGSFNCNHCKHRFKSQGWCGEHRHIHGLKSSYYLLQRQ